MSENVDVRIGLFAIALLILAIAIFLSGCSKKPIEEHNIRIPAPTKLDRSIKFPQSYFYGVTWCVPTTAMIKIVRVDRRLTNGEVWTIYGGCFLPLIGETIIEQIWGGHPEWNQFPPDPNGPINERPKYTFDRGPE